MDINACVEGEAFVLISTRSSWFFFFASDTIYILFLAYWNFSSKNNNQRLQTYVYCFWIVRYKFRWFKLAIICVQLEILACVFVFPTYFVHWEYMVLTLTSKLHKLIVFYSQFYYLTRILEPVTEIMCNLPTLFTKKIISIIHFNVKAHAWIQISIEKIVIAFLSRNSSNFHWS